MSIKQSQTIETTISCDGIDCTREWKIIETGTGDANTVPPPPVIIGEDFDKTRVVVLQDGGRKLNYCGNLCESKAIKAGKHDRLPKPGAALADLRAAFQANNEAALADSTPMEPAVKEPLPAGLTAHTCGEELPANLRELEKLNVVVRQEASAVA